VSVPALAPVAPPVPAPTKSFELYVQAAIWMGGIAAAGTGGLLAAILNPDLPASVLVWLRLVGAALVIALFAAAYMQFHAIAALNAKERSETSTSSQHIATSQRTMLLAFGCSALFLLVGLICFHREPKSTPQWLIAGSGASAGESWIVLSRLDGSKIKILTRSFGESTWSESVVNPP
jgi:hypothetical protein